LSYTKLTSQWSLWHYICCLMPEQKYKKYYQLMWAQNQQLFEEFIPIHDGFVADQLKWSDQFNQVGRDVVDVIRDWERRLCAGTEKGGYGAYSAKLAEKFWEEVKKQFPLIQEVGIKRS
jgi:hypothetical protein